MTTLVAGSYERFIWGFSLQPLKHSQALTLAPLFSYPSHTGPIKTLAVAGPIAASGGADDTIKIYDLSASSEIGSFLDHSAPVTALAFYTSPAAPSFPRNLISAAADGELCIYDADPFVHLKTLVVHRKGVNDLALHGSGRVALTVGKDSCLAMVNLVRGRRCFSCRLDREAEIVRYDGESGERFFMVSEDKVGVHCSEDAKIVCEIKAERRVLCVAAGESGLLLAGGEDRIITAWDTRNGKVAYRVEDAHSARVKGLVVFKNKSDGQTSDAPHLLASASSDGIIKIWDIRMISEKTIPLAEANTKSRLTCLAGSSTKRYIY